jgi:hypothetical protein
MQTAWRILFWAIAGPLAITALCEIKDDALRGGLGFIAIFALTASMVRK